MNFIDAAKSGFIKYVDFKGRASRSEYWYFVLALGLIGILIALVEIYRGVIPFIFIQLLVLITVLFLPFLVL